MLLKISVVLFLICMAIPVFSEELNSTESRNALNQVLENYIRLYRAETLEEWKQLFHPGVIVCFPADDGTINVRNLEEFVERQKNYFAKRKSISERLENTSLQEGRRIARFTADFIFIDEGAERRGKLGLHLAEGTDGWKIVAVLFSYNEA